MNPKPNKIYNVTHSSQEFEAEVSFTGGRNIFLDLEELGSDQPPKYYGKAPSKCAVTLPDSVDFLVGDLIKISGPKVIVQATAEQVEQQSSGRKIAFCDVTKVEKL